MRPTPPPSRICAASSCTWSIKGRKDRYAMLSPVQLERLRAWWRLAHAQDKMLPGGCLFPGMDPTNPLTARQLNRAINIAAETATHHPHVHGIVPDGGLAADGTTWIACRPGFFLPVRVLSRLFRRRFLEGLQDLHRDERLQFFGEHAALRDAKVFRQWLAPMRSQEWVVYAKRPFAGPQAVLAYLSRYTHRVAISNSRLVAMDERGVTFGWKDYRAKGRTRHKTMTLQPQEFMRRFLLHVLPTGFHRIRHYGLLANGNRRDCLTKARAALQISVETTPDEPATHAPTFTCWHCGRPLLILEIVMRERASIRAPPSRDPGP